MSDTTLPVPHILPRGSFSRALVALMFLVALGDWLGNWLSVFFRSPGAGMALWGLCLIATCIATVSQRPTRRQMVRAGLTGMAAQIPWLLAPGFLPFCSALVGTAIAAAFLTSGAAPDWRRGLAILNSMIWKIIPDFVHAWRLHPPMAQGRFSLAAGLGWLVPIGGGVLFLALFADANPILSNWLAAANPLNLLSKIPVSQVIYLLLLAALVWPFLKNPAVTVGSAKPKAAPRPEAVFFTTKAIRRALIIFNLLFALQTGLDAIYLWAGAKLPAGLTYADYAHRGAYPLILTALLAGGFAIIATNPGSQAAASRAIKWLVLAWVAQNLALVAAAIFRLYLYVETYSLTELRLASFLWMGLVFTGLVFIILRILHARSNRWLLGANVMAALTVLYVSGCLNWPWIVAAYDVAHCSDVTGTGAALDVSYLQSLGPQTIPALDHFQVLTTTTEPGPFAQVGEAGQARTALADGPIASNDWRSFSVYNWTLLTYLTIHQPTHPTG